MTVKKQKKICLAMIVRDEEQIIERCLTAVKPFIDSWLIHDLGSRDNTVKLIEKTMDGVPGEVKSGVLFNFSDARNDLLDDAKKLGDLVLMIDADEVLQCLSASIRLGDDAQIGLIDIIQTNHNVRQARLFRSDAIPTFLYPVLEEADLQNFSIESVDNVGIKHYCDGFRHRLDNRVRIDHFLIENELDQSPDNIELRLKLGQLELQQNNIERALKQFESVISNSSNKNTAHIEIYWQAYYLAAGILNKQGNTPKAIELYTNCFNYDETRLEPLIRLAEIHHIQGEHSISEQLCELVSGQDIPDLARYYEPSAYLYWPSLILAEIALISEDKASATDILDALIKAQALPGNIDEQVQKIRAKATTKTSDQQKDHALNINQAGEKKPTLSIGMATHDDYDGVYFSIMSIVLYHQEILDQIEILVVDNNPSSAHGAAVKSLCDRVEVARYVAAGEYNGTTIKGLVFSEARGDITLCMDCHVFLHEGAIARLIEYFKQNPNTKDLLHGPLFYDNYTHYSTHMDERWNGGFYGTWGTDERAKELDGEPFEIPLQGMGLFACRREYWLGFNTRFRGFGGEEGYIHEKFRQHGGQTLCLPFLRWTHRFDRPNGINYPNKWEDRIRNYLLGWHELNLDLAPVLAHFSKHINHDVTASAYAAVRYEIAGPLWCLDTIYCLVDSDEQWQQIQVSLKLLAIDHVTQRIDRNENLSRLFEIAQKRTLKDIALIDGAVEFDSALNSNAQSIVSALNQQECDVMYSNQLAKKSNNAYPTLGAHLSIIKQTTFAAAAACFAEKQTLSKAALLEFSPSLSAFEL